MEKLEDPGRLTVDLNLLRTVERKLESKRRKSRAPECLGMETRDIPRRSGVLDFRRFDSSFRSKFETDRDIPGPWIFGVLIRVSARQFEAD